MVNIYKIKNKKIYSMKYGGSLAPRNVDEKRCIIWPEEWPYNEQGFVFVQEKDIEIYPYKAWKVSLKKKGKKSKQKEEKKIKWFGKSSPRAYLDSQKRLPLPQYCAGWKSVTLIGVGKHIIIRESTE